MKYELDKVKEEGFEFGYNIGKTIKMLRKKINLTQDDLATSTGLSVQAIHMILMVILQVRVILHLNMILLLRISLLRLIIFH